MISVENLVGLRSEDNGKGAFRILLGRQAKSCDPRIVRARGVATRWMRRISAAKIKMRY